MQEIETTIDKDIQLTVDVTSMNESGFMPVLNLELKMSGQKVEFRHYSTPMISPFCIMYQFLTKRLYHNRNMQQNFLLMQHLNEPHVTIRSGLLLQ